jgi:hypothetical protein
MSNEPHTDEQPTGGVVTTGSEMLFSLPPYRVQTVRLWPC